MTSCVPLSHCVQSAKLLSRWLYLILVHLNSFSGCLLALCTVAARCRSKDVIELLIPYILWAFHALCYPEGLPVLGVAPYSPGSQALCGFGTHLMASFSHHPLMLYVQPLGS